MELIKRNIHMDRIKRSTVIQFTMEEDLNLPEDKPDISTLNLEKGPLKKKFIWRERCRQIL